MFETRIRPKPRFDLRLRFPDYNASTLTKTNNIPPKPHSPLFLILHGAARQRPLVPSRSGDPMMCSFVSRRQCERGRTRHRFAQFSWKKTGGVTSLTQNRYNEKTGVEPRFGRKPRFGPRLRNQSVSRSVTNRKSLETTRSSYRLVAFCQPRSCERSV